MAILSILNLFISWPAVAIAIVTLIVYYYITCRVEMSKYPPGPFPLPFIGNLHLLRAECIHAKLTELSKVYGPLVTVWLGSKPMVIACDGVTAKEILITKSRTFAGRPVSKEMQEGYFGKGGKGVGTCDYGDSWKRNRRFVHTAVQVEGNKFDFLHGLVIGDVNEFIADIGEEEGKPFYMREKVHFAFASSICKLLFNVSITKNGKAYEKLVELNDLVQAIARPSLFHAIMKRLLPYRQSQTKQFWSDFVGIFKYFIECFDKKVDAYSTERASLGHILESTSKSDDSFSVEEWPVILGDVYVAAIDTGHNNIIWAILYLAHHPDKQKALHKNIDDNWGDDSVPLYLQKENFPYVEAVWYETLRYSSVLSLALPHKTLEDTTVAGHKIKKGTRLFINHDALNNDHTQWDHPEEFKPERFINAKGKFQVPTEYFFLFGGGARMCIGHSFGRLKQFLFILKTFRTYEFKFPDDQPNPTLKGIRSFSWRPQDYKVIAVRR